MAARRSKSETPRVDNANAAPPQLRAKLWVERPGPTTILLTESGADLLEQIHAVGSLSEAARRLHYAYRRAWMLVDAMNKHWPQPLVVTAAGGKSGGGTTLTEYGLAVLAAYRDVQVQLEHAIDQASQSFALATRPQSD